MDLLSRDKSCQHRCQNHCHHHQGRNQVLGKRLIYGNLAVASSSFLSLSVSLSSSRERFPFLFFLFSFLLILCFLSLSLSHFIIHSLPHLRPNDNFFPLVTFKRLVYKLNRQKDTLVKCLNPFWVFSRAKESSPCFFVGMDKIY